MSAAGETRRDYKFWTPEEDAEVRRLRTEGVSWSAISRLMGKDAHARIFRHLREADPFKGPKQQVAKAVRAPSTQAPLSAAREAWTPLGRGQPCQWPTTEGRRHFFRCCEPPKPGKPYCDDHCSQAYVRASVPHPPGAHP